MIEFASVVYRAGAFHMDVSLRVEAGQYFVLLGPTGSGKTACVECLAGLRAIQSGRIMIGSRDVTVAEPRLRSIGYVPQDYALFPQRTVRENIAFGPRVRRWARAEVASAVAQAAELIGIAHLLDRRVPGLSGGERQRVALARAIAARPDVLILDEPVSALDEFTRDRICGELRRLQGRLGVTTLHVCHNIEEGLAVADAAAVIRNGRIEQAGSMPDLLRRPRTEFVARFMRCENVLTGVAEGDGSAADTTRVRVADVRFDVPGRHQGPVVFVARPENWNLVREAARPAAAPNTVRGQVSRIIDRGAYLRVELDGPVPMVIHLPHPALPAGASDGAAMAATVPTGGIHVLPAG